VPSLGEFSVSSACLLWQEEAVRWCGTVLGATSRQTATRRYSVCEGLVPTTTVLLTA